MLQVEPDCEVSNCNGASIQSLRTGTKLSLRNCAVSRQINDIRLKRQSPSLVTCDLDVTGDFTDVRDAVRASPIPLERGVNGEVYKLCSGEERSLRSLLARMLQLTSVDAQRRVDPALF